MTFMESNQKLSTKQLVLLQNIKCFYENILDNICGELNPQKAFVILWITLQMLLRYITSDIEEGNEENGF